MALIGTTLLDVVVTVRPTALRDTEASEFVGVTSTFLALAAVGFMKLRPAPPPPTIGRLPLAAAERMRGVAAVRFPTKRAEARLELEPFIGTAPTAAPAVTAVRREPARDTLLVLFVIELREALELDRLRFSLELVVAACCDGRLLEAAVPDVVLPPLRPFPFRSIDPDPAGALTKLEDEFELFKLTRPPPDRVKVEDDVRPLPPMVGLDLRTESLPLEKVDLFRDRVEELMLG